MRKLLLVLTGAMLSFYSFADLGEIKINSYLSQPLNATIPITGVSEASLSELSIGLASNTKFKNNGIIFNPELGSLQFKIMNLKGAPYLQITSSRAISSPVLSVLLHYQQNTDDFYRQYTLLLDPITLNDAPVAGGNTEAPVENVQREIVLTKIAGEKPISISGNSGNKIKVGATASPKNLWAMDFTNPEVAKQLSSFNATTMLFITHQDDSLYTVARFEQLIYPNAHFSLNQIIVALGLENYPKLKPLTQVYESGVALALPLPQDVNLIQARLADQYLLDSTLTPLARQQLLAGIAHSYDVSLNVESSELFIGKLAKATASTVVVHRIKKPLLVTSVPLIVDDNNYLELFLEYKYYLLVSLLILLGALFRKKIKQFLIRKKMNGVDEDSLYSAAATLSKNARKNLSKRENNQLNPEPYDFLVRGDSVATDGIDTSDDLSSDLLAASSEAAINHKYIDEELINALENILAFDENRDDIRYKLFELYLNANRFDAASVAYVKLDKALDEDSALREGLSAMCLQYAFVPKTSAQLADSVEVDNNLQMVELATETGVLMPSGIDLAALDPAQLLNQAAQSASVEVENTINFAVSGGTSASLDFAVLKPVNLAIQDAVKTVQPTEFADERLLDFSVVSATKNTALFTQNTLNRVDEDLLTYPIKSEANGTDDSYAYYDERLNLAQMYFQIEEFVKATEILTELLSASGVPSEIKVCAAQLLSELKLNG